MTYHNDLFPEKILRAELVQRLEAGFDIGDLPERVEAAIAAGRLAASAEGFWKEIEDLPSPAQASLEPQDLEAILASRSPVARSISGDYRELSPPALYDRIYGAWLGRCAGCTLGKPVEGYPRARIKSYLQAANAYPLHSYFPVIDPFPEGLELWKCYIGTTLGSITHMVRDDDIDYTVLGLRVLETYGRGFTSQDIARSLLDNLPFNKVYTAEAVAYQNLVNGIPPPDSALYRNPYREWIGAQIRADMWGYANPGDPQRAAEFAYRDSSVSHTQNGIYGAMWAAACIAAAFTTLDPLEVILAGLAEIPAECRLAEAIRSTLGWYQQSRSWEATWELIDQHYGAYHTVHVIPNSCMVALGLLAGQGSLGESLCVTVMGGWDTDCTCATVGSIVGAMRGAANLPAAWIEPLNDRLESLIYGFQDSRISDLAQRTVRFIQESIYAN